MDNISSSRRATAWRDSDSDLPPDFDPDEHPILARHWFGIDPHELREVCEVYWSLAREVYPPTAAPGVILLDGGAS